MKKLRLLVTEKCNRACPGCCNKDWDLKNLPVCNDFTGYDEIMLTGGEPLLDVPRLLDLVARIREAHDQVKVLVYTAYAERVLHVLPYVDGVTLTLHEPKGVSPLWELDNVLDELQDAPWVENASLRLNVFKGITNVIPSTLWQIKSDIEWLENCPLPEDEVFMRL